MKPAILVLALIAGFAPAAPVGAADTDIVVVVSSQSTITELNPEQITNIFLGLTNRFPDGTPAVPIDQPARSPALVEFYARFANHTPAQMKMHWSKLIFTGRGQPPRRVSDSTAVKAVLESNPNAIGYIDRKLVDATVTVLTD